MIRKWSVNMRLELAGYKIPQKAMKWVFSTYTFRCVDGAQGFYKKFPEGIAFVGCPFGNHPFADTYGWFPSPFPYDDPYQPIHKDMTAEEFEQFLKLYGFEEVS